LPRLSFVLARAEVVVVKRTVVAERSAAVAARARFPASHLRLARQYFSALVLAVWVQALKMLLAAPAPYVAELERLVVIKHTTHIERYRRACQGWLWRPQHHSTG